ncbi:SDR family NAD(P)-dependent oxidoreductase [Alteromonas facilis]|uniref:SDR family NAD(P)-dependent oxidoreductase n=1 Tax=Alteromonas facilis TaxID=2048004 RepID=UPI000C28999E|nr:SDR family oxidoreductase [Alteromonas facilis]
MKPITTIITGGSMGIGLAIAEQQSQAGAHVYNLDLQDFECSVPNATWIKCDVSNVTAVHQAISTIVAQSGHIDRLVCNAGRHLSATIEETSEDMLDAIFAVNVKGAYASIQAVLPSMKAQQKGAIILMGSDQSFVGKQNSFAYGLTKSALASIAKTTALDYAGDNIRVNAVCPGTIETPLFHNAIDKYVQQSGADKQLVLQEEASLQPLGKLGQPEDVAALVGFLLSDDAKFITGSLHAVDGGYTAQ